MTEEQTNDMMLMMEQLAGDIRELTYAIRENTEVVERGVFVDEPYIKRLYTEQMGE